MFHLKSLPALLGLSMLLLGACSRKNPPVTPEAPDNEPVEQRTENIDFRASGNEPFWSVEIDLDGNLTYNTAENGRELSVPLPAPEPLRDSNSVRYAVQSGARSLTVTITATACEDDMSGLPSPYTVEIQTDGQTHRGCGRYTSEQPLDTAQWTVVSLGGAPVTPSNDFPRGVPYLSLDLAQNRVTGNAGCNGFSGPVTVSAEGQLTFGPLISTKMACPALDLENRIMGMLSNNMVSYTLLPGRLLLRQGGTAIEFQRGARTR